jgi:hypothetical protein
LQTLDRIPGGFTVSDQQDFRHPALASEGFKV